MKGGCLSTSDWQVSPLSFVRVSARLITKNAGDCQSESQKSTILSPSFITLLAHVHVLSHTSCRPNPVAQIPSCRNQILSPKSRRPNPVAQIPSPKSNPVAIKSCRPNPVTQILAHVQVLAHVYVLSFTSYRHVLSPRPVATSCRLRPKNPPKPSRTQT